MLIRDACWKESADVVVVGYGGAGAVAAIAAHDLGAQVLVVEKQPADAHYTNTQMSGGVFICPTDVEKVIGYVEALYRVEEDLAWTDRETLRAWAGYTHQNKAWVEGMGAHLKLFARGAEHREIPGWECVDLWQFAGSGLGLHRFLTTQVSRRGIRVLDNTPAQKLLTDLDGRVVGVRVAGENQQTLDIEARRAVIMTTGGFEFDESMKLNYLRVYPTHFYGTPANTGDGHRMVMELGADMWHMNCCSARLVAKFPDFPIAFSLEFGGKHWFQRVLVRGESAETGEEVPGYIVVDRDGRRFTSENFKTHTLYYELTVYDSHRLRYPRVPCFWIFDRRRMAAGPLPLQLAGPSGPVQLYRWSKDNSVELDKGWIVQGESLVALAEKLGIPPGNLVETVDRYNSYCALGDDPEFHRRPSDLAPLCHPPFYALRLYPGGPNTQGGPRRNHRAQVLNVDGRPIPRLYAAGEFGSIYGMLYPAGGGNIAECIAFGRIAAENAVREEAL